MPQYDHHHHHPPPSWRQDCGAQVMDLETAVKDGVLGGAVAGAGAGGLTSAEKLDLRKMVEELDDGAADDVPAVFICPISLQPMVEPVTLCTGQTYERANIARWLAMGRPSCPTTMQELWDDALTPNSTLRHLILAWFSQRHLLARKRSHDARGCAADLLAALRRAKGHARVPLLRDLRRLAAAHASARAALAEPGGAALLSSLLGPLTSHAVGSEVVAILAALPLDADAKAGLAQPARMSLLVDVLNEGSGDTKLDCARLVEALISEEKAFRPEMVSSPSLLVGLMKMARDKKHLGGVSAALRLLKLICAHRQPRAIVVSVGAVPQIVESLPRLAPECAESALGILDAVSSTPEGRAALKDCPQAIPALVRLLMRVSEPCTHCALNVLGEMCRMSPDECAPAAVEAGLAAKLLLVLQSGCGPALKQRAAELLKLCSLNYSATHFISKCKLTRTIQ